MEEALEYLSINETNALLKAIDNDRDHAIITLILTTGIFVNELLNLEIEDVDFFAKLLKIKGSRKRNIPLTDQPYEALARWTKSRPTTPTTHFFVTAKGQAKKLTVGSIDKLIRKYSDRAGIQNRVNAKILRNTFAVNLFSRDISATIASEILGISDPDSLKRYLKTAKQRSTNIKPEMLKQTDTRPKLTQIFSTWFPVKPTPAKAVSHIKGNLTANPEELILGRTQTLKEIKTSLTKKQSLLLTGKTGMGLTHILKNIAATGSESMIYIATPVPIKKLITDICDKLNLNWQSLGKPSTAQLLIYLLENSQRADLPVLLLDNLHRLRTSDLDILLEISTRFTMIGATNALIPKLNKLWWKFKQVEILPLDEDASKELIKYLTQNLTIKDYTLMETKLLNLANGNPSALVDMAKQLSYSSSVGKAEIDTLFSDEGATYRDWTPLLIVLWGVIVAFRFLALGTHSFEGYIIAGIGTSTLLVMRYFMQRLR